MLGPMVVIGYLSVRVFNPFLWAKETQAPEIPTVELQDDAYLTVSINPLPTLTTGSADNTTQHETLPSATEGPCILNSIFAADPSDVIVFPGAPPMVKLTNLTAACNGSIIEVYEFVTMLVADVPKFFPNSAFVSTNKTSSSPVAPESANHNASLGVKIPFPEWTDLNTSSPSWHLTKVFQGAYQDKKLKSFVELAGRNFYLLGSLLNKVMSPLLILLPKGSSPTPLILISLTVITGIYSQTREERRQLVIGHAPLIARSEWLQYLALFFGGGIASIKIAIGAKPEAGPQAQQSIFFSVDEVQAVVQTMRTLVLFIEGLPVTSGHQDDDQGGDDDDRDGDGDFVDLFQTPFQLQDGISSHIDANGMLLTKYYAGGCLSGTFDRILGDRKSVV